jgi:UDP-GlcNAc3NAcA epimerase
MSSAEAGRSASPLVWLSIVGARPQFIKLAPVCRAIETHNAICKSAPIEHRIVHTGQHYDRELAELPLAQMNVPEPDFNLAVGSSSPGTQLARMLERLEPVLESEQPNWVIVYGDTTSTLAGALLASRLGLPLAHVEAGCRSTDMRMPEEQARIVADHLSQLLLAPSPSAIDNLEREGIGVQDDPRRRRNVLVGDVMYDALLQNLKSAGERTNETLRRHELKPGGYYLLTLHRAENTDRPELLRTIVQTAGTLDLPVLFPVHPRTRAALAAAGISVNGKVRPVAPQGYLEMLALERNAHKILTDSGGVQKEAFYLGVPCVTLRDRSEWPETVELGANKIGGTSPQTIREAVAANHPSHWITAAPYGNGNAANKIVTELLAAARL